MKPLAEGTFSAPVSVMKGLLMPYVLGPSYLEQPKMEYK